MMHLYIMHVKFCIICIYTYCVYIIHTYKPMRLHLCLGFSTFHMR